MKNRHLYHFIFCIIIVLSHACMKNENGQNSGSSRFSDISDRPFDELHSLSGNTKDRYLYFGNIKIKKPGVLVKKELKSFLGRWEGAKTGTPVKNDWLAVLTVYEISGNLARICIGTGTDMHYPLAVAEITATPVKKNGRYFLSYTGPVITPRGTIDGEIIFWLDDADETLKFSVSGTDSAFNEMFDCRKNETVLIFKNLRNDLGKRNITVHEFSSPKIKEISGKYLLYDPSDNTGNGKLPLLVFFHGSGDTGLDPLALWKASPFRYIADKGSLPFLMVAPVLNKPLQAFPSDFFPMLLNEIRQKYKIDESRIYVTGLSMGGFAAWESAFSMPDRIAAIAPLSCADTEFFILGRERFRPFTDDDYRKIKGMPVYAVNGRLDPIIPAGSAVKTFEKAKNSGINMKYEIIEDGDHDTWSKTYGSMEFYNQLLQHSLPAKK
ncbi:MAG: hypothetical protein JW982_16280 [Spirochaetes bacterium]|nr:hypothetical protein [Spirochaetota bacterium]